LVTDRYGDDEPRQESGMSAGHPAQRGGSFRRHIDVATEDGPIDDGLVEADPEPSSADNLVEGDVPEEDGVDQRVEPAVWLTDGSAEGAGEGPEPAGQTIPPGQTIPGDQAGAAGPVLADGPAAPDMPLPGHAYPSPDTPPPADGITAPAYQRQPPPYPAQVPPAATPSVASRITAPFAALTRPRPKKPARPRPAVPPRPRQVAAPRPAPKGADHQTRRAQLVLSRIEPWSVMKFSFMISLVGWVVLFVAVAALYYVLNKLGVFHSIQSTITSVTSGKDSTGADSNGKWFSASRILGYTMLVGAINVVLITALSTVGAVIYNLVTRLAGGIEVTLKETD
jgi:Transmembrane domain of unknown function (DUF3566)